MAYIHKLPSGLWRAEIVRKPAGATKPIRLSDSFTSKAAATNWAAREEAAIIDGTASRWPAKTLGDAIDRYERTESAKHAGRFDAVAFGLMRREYPALLATVLHQITPADIAEWRDHRLQTVSGSTVLRYVGLLRHVWSIAASVWQWCPNESPWSAIKWPAHNPSRERLIGWREARAILRRLNYLTGVRPVTKMQETAFAFLLGLRTAMRASEIIKLTGDRVDLSRRVVRLIEHKTRKTTMRDRHVPLTPQGVRLLTLLHKSGPLFTVQSGSLDALFRKARDQAMVDGVTFHDSRAAATTYLARKVDMMTLARITGHRDVKSLMVYYRESEESIAARLALPSARPRSRPTRPADD